MPVSFLTMFSYCGPYCVQQVTAKTEVLPILEILESWFCFQFCYEKKELNSFMSGWQSEQSTPLVLVLDGEGIPDSQ
jgi:hypothetical protein